MSEQKKNPANANNITRDYLDSILIEERLIDSVLPSLELELFGEKFATPIMMPAFSHLKAFIKDRENAMLDYALAAKNLEAVNFVGMSENDDFGEILETYDKTVRIIKPYADRDKILSQLTYAKEHGALAVGMDIDHIFGSDGQYDNVMGELMAPQTTADLREYVQTTDLPFVVKGVLSVRDAAKCAEAGVQAILVSHHSGRLPFAVPPLMVLPEIAKEVGSTMKIFVDCGINSGADAYKALALGADAVAVGRALFPGLIQEGNVGVEKYVQKMNQELAYIMAFTGCASLKDMDPTVLRLPKQY